MEWWSSSELVVYWWVGGWSFSGLVGWWSIRGLVVFSGLVVH